MVTSDSGDEARVSTSGGIQAGLAGRYATALFETARDDKQLESVGGSIEKVKAALAASDDFRELTRNPVLSRQEAEAAIAGIAKSLELDPTTTRFLGVLARNRRLGPIDGIIGAFEELVALHRGEATARVTSAHGLDDDQLDALRTKLRSRLGRDVAIETMVDPSILGGLVVRIGSQMIDGSIRTKLNTLAHAMKG